jgi:hypothetical protein
MFRAARSCWGRFFWSRSLWPPGWLAICPTGIEEAAALAAAIDEKNAIPVVTTTVVRSAPLDVDLELPGSISSLTEASIFARASGYVSKRYADIGDHREGWPVNGRNRRARSRSAGRSGPRRRSPRRSSNLARQGPRSSRRSPARSRRSPPNAITSSKRGAVARRTPKPRNPTSKPPTLSWTPSRPTSRRRG